MIDEGAYRTTKKSNSGAGLTLPFWNSDSEFLGWYGYDEKRGNIFLPDNAYTVNTNKTYIIPSIYVKNADKKAVAFADAFAYFVGNDVLGLNGFKVFSAKSDMTDVANINIGKYTSGKAPYQNAVKELIKNMPVPAEWNGRTITVVNGDKIYTATVADGVATFTSETGFATPEFEMKTGDIKVEGAQATLTENINKNFKVTLPSNVKDNDYMTFTLPGGKVRKALVSDAKQPDGSYIFICPLVAKQMGDTVTMTFHQNGKDVPVAAYSVKDYAKAIMAGTNESAKAVVKSMLNDGAALQTYFGYNTDTHVNEGLETGTVTKYTDFKTVAPITNSAKLTTLSAALNLEDTVGIKFYFTLPTDENVSKCTFSYTKGGNTVTLTPFTERDRYCVEIPGLYTTNFNWDYTFTATATAGITTFTYGVYYFAGQTTEGTALRNLVNAMADYCAAGTAYKA